MKDEHGPQHAFDLHFQKISPKKLGLTNGRFLVEPISSQDGPQKIYTVFCSVTKRPCNPQTTTTQAIVAFENQEPLVKVIHNGNEVTNKTPILCTDCPVARKTAK